ncbi:hypothetical Protein YC6258_03999 [Gynuella sunshinyii YC6258]|uniref:Uncharacterized protein n=1 Tax=Gynuella sunshinyii YC6258 TaxID=1445510 RepID=A0A0C5V9J1_9GAMM|nr:hypothetical Protein YC6258_03999 [Gynuella sunshinyii YC6258]
MYDFIRNSSTLKKHDLKCHIKQRPSKHPFEKILSFHVNLIKTK